MIEYGIQMYSVRDVAKTDLKQALRLVSEMGYQTVEFAGFFGHSAGTVRSWLDEYHLTCSGTHTQLSDLCPEKIEATVRYHQEIGCQNLIIPGVKWDTEEDMQTNLSALNQAQKQLAENGIVLGYHNHSKEFQVTPYGKVVENELLAQTDLQLELDTFWIFNAGLDPVSFLEQNRSRIQVIHLKDGIPTLPECRNYEHVHDGVVGKALGEGKAPVQAVREWTLRNKVRIVVESEGLSPTGPEEVERCIRYLRSLE